MASKRLLTEINNDPFQLLSEWINRHGGVIENNLIELCDDKSLGYHLRASQDLACGDVIMTIPSKFMITWSTVLSSNLGKAFINHWPTYTNHVIAIEEQHSRLAYMKGNDLLADILHHRQLAEAPLNDNDRPRFTQITDRGILIAFLSFHRFNPEIKMQDSQPDEFSNEQSCFKFMGSLPNQFSLPSSWTEKQLQPLAECILGVSVLQSVAALTAVLVNDFRALVALSRQKVDGLEQLKSYLVSAQLIPNLNNQPPISKCFQNYVWASSASSSRSFGDLEGMSGVVDERGANLGIMVPVLDMLNCDVEAAQIEWKCDIPSSESSASTSSPQHPYAVIRKPVTKGEQLLTHYGAFRGNAEFLINYGFAQWGNGAEELAIGWSVNDVPIEHQSCVIAHLPEFVAFLTESSDKTMKEDQKEREDELVVALKGGSCIELILTHTMAIPNNLVSLVRAMFQTIQSSHNDVRSSEEQIQSGRIWEYIAIFLNGKLRKLIQHLHQVLSPQYGVLWNEEINDENVTLLWDQLVALQDTVIISQNRYAVDPQACVLAYFDAKLGLIQHALESAKADHCE